MVAPPPTGGVGGWVWGNCFRLLFDDFVYGFSVAFVDVFLIVVRWCFDSLSMVVQWLYNGFRLLFYGYSMVFVDVVSFQQNLQYNCKDSRG